MATYDYEFELNIEIEDYEELASVKSFKGHFLSSLTIKEIIQKIAKKANVNIDEKDVSFYALFSKGKKTKPFAMEDKLKDILQSGDTVVLKKKGAKDIVRLDIHIDNYAKLKTPMNIAHIFNQTDQVDSILHYVCEVIRKKGANGPFKADPEACALFLPTSKSKKGILMDGTKPLAFYSLQSQTSVVFKFREKEDIILNIEIFDYRELGCAKSISAIFNMNITVEETIRKIARKGNVFLGDTSRFKLSLPSGQKMKRDSKLSDYVVDKGTIILRKRNSFFSPLWGKANASNALVLGDISNESSPNESRGFYSPEHEKLYWSLSCDNYTPRRPPVTSSDDNYLFKLKSDEGRARSPPKSPPRSPPSKNKLTSEQIDIISNSFQKKSPPKLAPKQSFEHIELPDPKMLPEETSQELLTRIKQPRDSRFERKGALQPRIKDVKGSPKKRPKDSLELVSLYYSKNKFWPVAVNAKCTVQDICKVIEKQNGMEIAIYEAELSNTEESGVKKYRKLDYFEVMSSIKEDWEGRRIFFAELSPASTSPPDSMSMSPRASRREKIPGTIRDRGDIRNLEDSQKEDNNNLGVPLKQFKSTAVATLVFDSKEEHWINPDEIMKEKKIGGGAFGKVYKGTYRNMQVAVKSLTGLVTEDQISSFKYEVEILSSVQTEFLVKFIGACIQNEKLTMVMEFCDHGSLYDVMNNKDEEFTWDRIRKWFKDALMGVSVLHKWDPPLVHRDLKSLNLLLDSKWNLKVCDFGLSRFRTMTNAVTLGELRGTMAYCPPEIYDGQLFSTRSDIYSLGIVLWEMCVRVVKKVYQRPFAEFNHISHDFQIIVLAAKEKLRPTMPNEVPAQLASIITQCWSHNADLRPTCDEILERLSENIDNNCL